MKYFSIDYLLDKVLLLSFLLNEQSKNGYCFVSGNEIKNWSMPSAIENTNPVWFNPILNTSEGITMRSDLVLNRIKRGGIMSRLPTMTGSRIQASTQEFQAFIPQQTQAQKKEQIQSFTPQQQIVGFTAEQIPTFTEEQIPHFTEQQILAFTEKQIKALTEKQIKVLTPQQIPYFETQQIPWFTCKQIAAFTCKQIAAFTWSQIKVFTWQQVASFRPDQINCFSIEPLKDQTQELPTADINEMALQNEFSISKDNSSLSNV